MDMSVVEDLAQKVPLPRMVRIEQHFDRTAIADIEGGVRSAISDRNVLDSIRPGMSVAVTAGSRGISNIALILRTIVRILKEKGAEPFVIPALRRDSWRCWPLWGLRKDICPARYAPQWK